MSEAEFGDEGGDFVNGGVIWGWPPGQSFIAENPCRFFFEILAVNQLSG